MKIYITNLTGKKSTVEIEGSDTLFDLKCRVQDVEGIPPDQQRLSFGGALIVGDDGLVLDRINAIQTRLSPNEPISESSYINLHLTLRLLGGGNEIHHRPVWIDSESDDELPRNGTEECSDEEMEEESEGDEQELDEEDAHAPLHAHNIPKPPNQTDVGSSDELKNLQLFISQKMAKMMEVVRHSFAGFEGNFLIALIQNYGIVDTRTAKIEAQMLELGKNVNGSMEVIKNELALLKTQVQDAKEAAGKVYNIPLIQKQVTSETRVHSLPTLDCHSGVKGLPDSLKTNLKKGIHGNDVDLSKRTESTSIIHPENGHSFWMFLSEAGIFISFVILVITAAALVPKSMRKDSKVGLEDVERIAFTAILLMISTAFVLLVTRCCRPSLMFQGLKEGKQNVHLERINQALQVIDSILVTQGQMRCTQEEWFVRTKMLRRVLCGTQPKDEGTLYKSTYNKANK